MTEEDIKLKDAEHRKNYIRMMDSLRNACKGEETCAGVDCGDCPFYQNNDCTTNYPQASPYKCIEVVERWMRNNPAMTNGRKFTEVFGNDAIHDGVLSFGTTWWCSKYEEPKKEGDDTNA